MTAAVPPPCVAHSTPPSSDRPEFSEEFRPEFLESATGLGQHQMWAAQHYAYKEPNSLITSGGLGAMGFEVPAALGAKVGRPDRMVWSIAGDGGFQMTMCDLATAVENNIDAKFAILNNGTLGMVRQWQGFFYDKDYLTTIYSGNPTS